MKKWMFACLLPLVLTAGCMEKPNPPVYGNSGEEIAINTTRYIQPVMQKTNAVISEANLLQGSGAGSLAQLDTLIEQTKQVITRAKSETSAMSYPAVMADQKPQTLDSLTKLELDLDSLKKAAEVKKGFLVATETVMSDTAALQAVVQMPQGK